MFSASGEEIPDDRGDVEGNKNDKGKILHEYPCTSHKANMCHRRAAATGPCLVCHSCVQDLRLKSEIEREREGVFSLSQSATSLVSPNMFLTYLKSELKSEEIIN